MTDEVRGFYVRNRAKEEAAKKARMGRLYWRRPGVAFPDPPDLSKSDTLEVIYLSGEENGNFFCEPYFGMLWKPLICVCDELAEELVTIYDRYDENPVGIPIPPPEKPLRKKRVQVQQST